MSVSRFLGRGLIGLSLLLMIALALVWAVRKPIARNVIDAELQRRGVAARYDVTAIGPSLQRMENLVIGDPARPDLTADWAEIVTRTRLDGVSISRIRAGGVRLRGVYDGQTLRLGAVDRLLPPPSGAPFSLPDIEVVLSDARMALATPQGRIGLRLDGAGNIANRFDGQLAALMPAAAVAPGCRFDRLSAYLKIATRGRSVSANGPLRADNVSCRGATIAAPAAQVNLNADEQLASVSGDLAARSSSIMVAGSRTDSARVEGQFRWANGRLTGEGEVSAIGFRPGDIRLRSLAKSFEPAASTPLEAIATAIKTAVLGLGRGVDARAHVAVAGNAGSGDARFSRISVRSRSGATLDFGPDAFARFDWPRAKYRLAGDVAVSGGGFPATRIAFDGRPNLSGTARIAPLTAGPTRLALTPVRFSLTEGALGLSTSVRFDGPVAGGTATGLTVPFTLAGGRPSGECLPFGLAGYRRDTLMLAPVRATICRRGDLVKSGPVDIRGRIGESPLEIRTTGVRFDTVRREFAADGLAVRLGDAKKPTRLDIASLVGALDGRAASGRFAGGAGQIGAVPLLLSEAGGQWRFTDGVLSIDGALRIADEAASPRFLPLVSRNTNLQLKDGLIEVTGTLREPFTGTAVTNISIRHDLARAAGGAVLDVPDLAFGQALQPERLTSVTLGVIANVQGRLSGRGEIDWNGEEVTSRGRFVTDNLDFAAAFGPVTGLKGEINFSDLLGLATPAGQQVSIASINPGVAVTDGLIRYRLQPGLKLAIEEGSWPFAGGKLTLAPSLLDLNQSAERRLTFRVDGLDAALFVQQMAFDNIAVTGRFDGVLPMVFDQAGGRIEMGTLAVRDGGGTLSYVGDVSNAELGRFSRLAFDALKSIRYRRLSLELNGALDGEMVTVVRFNGVNQLPLAQSRNFFLKQFNELPFLFNITIKAPFRGLFSMVRSFNDPSVFIPRGLEALPETPASKPVQTKESETVQ